jgi:hypothetical protein
MIAKQIGVEILTDINISTFPDCERVAYGMLSLSLCASLESAWPDWFYSHSVFKSLPIINQCTLNIIVLEY